VVQTAVADLTIIVNSAERVAEAVQYISEFEVNHQLEFASLFGSLENVLIQAYRGSPTLSQEIITRILDAFSGSVGSKKTFKENYEQLLKRKPPKSQGPMEHESPRSYRCNIVFYPKVGEGIASTRQQVFGGSAREISESIAQSFQTCFPNNSVFRHRSNIDQTLGKLADMPVPRKDSTYPAPEQASLDRNIVKCDTTGMGTEAAKKQCIEVFPPESYQGPPGSSPGAESENKVYQCMVRFEHDNLTDPVVVHEKNLRGTPSHIMKEIWDRVEGYFPGCEYIEYRFHSDNARKLLPFNLLKFVANSAPPVKFVNGLQTMHATQYIEVRPNASYEGREGTGDGGAAGAEEPQAEEPQGTPRVGFAWANDPDKHSGSCMVHFESNTLEMLEEKVLQGTAEEIIDGIWSDMQKLVRGCNSIVWRFFHESKRPGKQFEFGVLREKQGVKVPKKFINNLRTIILPGSDGVWPVYIEVHPSLQRYDDPSEGGEGGEGGAGGEGGEGGEGGGAPSPRPPAIRPSPRQSSSPSSSVPDSNRTIYECEIHFCENPTDKSVLFLLHIQGTFQQIFDAVCTNTRTKLKSDRGGQHRFRNTDILLPGRIFRFLDEGAPSDDFCNNVNWANIYGSQSPAGGVEGDHRTTTKFIEVFPPEEQYDPPGGQPGGEGGEGGFGDDISQVQDSQDPGPPTGDPDEGLGGAGGSAASSPGHTPSARRHPVPPAGDLGDFQVIHAALKRLTWLCRDMKNDAFLNMFTPSLVIPRHSGTEITPLNLSTFIRDHVQEIDSIPALTLEAYALNIIAIELSEHLRVSTIQQYVTYHKEIAAWWQYIQATHDLIGEEWHPSAKALNAILEKETPKGSCIPITVDDFDAATVLLLPKWEHLCGVSYTQACAMLGDREPSTDNVLGCMNLQLIIYDAIDTTTIKIFNDEGRYTVEIAQTRSARLNRPDIVNDSDGSATLSATQQFWEIVRETREGASNPTGGPGGAAGDSGEGHGGDPGDVHEAPGGHEEQPPHANPPQPPSPPHTDNSNSWKVQDWGHGGPPAWFLQIPWITNPELGGILQLDIGCIAFLVYAFRFTEVVDMPKYIMQADRVTAINLLHRELDAHVPDTNPLDQTVVGIQDILKVLTKNKSPNIDAVRKAVLQFHQRTHEAARGSPTAVHPAPAAENDRRSTRSQSAAASRTSSAAPSDPPLSGRGSRAPSAPRAAWPQDKAAGDASQEVIQETLQIVEDAASAVPVAVTGDTQIDETQTQTAADEIPETQLHDSATSPVPPLSAVPADIPFALSTAQVHSINAEDVRYLMWTCRRIPPTEFDKLFNTQLTLKSFGVILKNHGFNVKRSSPYDANRLFTILSSIVLEGSTMMKGIVTTHHRELYEYISLHLETQFDKYKIQRIHSTTPARVPPGRPGGSAYLLSPRGRGKTALHPSLIDSPLARTVVPSGRGRHVPPGAAASAPHTPRPHSSPSGSVPSPHTGSPAGSRTARDSESHSPILHDTVRVAPGGASQSPVGHPNPLSGFYAEFNPKPLDPTGEHAVGVKKLAWACRKMSAPVFNILMAKPPTGEITVAQVKSAKNIVLPHTEKRSETHPDVIVIRDTIVYLAQPDTQAQADYALAAKYCYDIRNWFTTLQTTHEHDFDPVNPMRLSNMWIPSYKAFNVYLQGQAPKGKCEDVDGDGKCQTRALYRQCYRTLTNFDNDYPSLTVFRQKLADDVKLMRQTMEHPQLAGDMTERYRKYALRQILICGKCFPANLGVHDLTPENYDEMYKVFTGPAEGDVMTLVFMVSFLDLKLKLWDITTCKAVIIGEGPQKKELAFRNFTAQKVDDSTGDTSACGGHYYDIQRMGQPKWLTQDNPLLKSSFADPPCLHLIKLGHNLVTPKDRFHTAPKLVSRLSAALSIASTRPLFSLGCAVESKSLPSTDSAQAAGDRAWAREMYSNKPNISIPYPTPSYVNLGTVNGGSK
jgi:hypothetical protein